MTNQPFFAWPGMWLFIAGLGVIGWEAVIWLRFGYWPGYDLRWLLVQMNWPLPGTSWIGVGRIVDWFLTFSLWGAALIVGFILFVLGGILDVKAEVRGAAMDPEMRKRLEGKLGRKLD